MKYLLDTHILLWWIEGAGRMNAAQQQAVASASPQKPLLLSDITLWEIATLVQLGRVRLAVPLLEWLEKAASPPLVRRCSISPAVAAECAGLPEHFHRDPADRLIVATARVEAATLLSCDAKIIGARVVPTL